MKNLSPTFFCRCRRCSWTSRLNWKSFLPVTNDFLSILSQYILDALFSHGFCSCSFTHSIDLVRFWYDLLADFNAFTYNYAQRILSDQNTTVQPQIDKPKFSPSHFLLSIKIESIVCVFNVLYFSPYLVVNQLAAHFFVCEKSVSNTWYVVIDDKVYTSPLSYILYFVCTLCAPSHSSSPYSFCYF